MYEPVSVVSVDPNLAYILVVSELVSTGCLLFQLMLKYQEICTI